MQTMHFLVLPNACLIGELEPTGEEYECALYLERMPQVKALVRNTSQQPNSFWLQTATDKFYPDFLAMLDDGRIVAVEHIGSFLSSSDGSKEKRLVGNLWAYRSDGKCIFLMTENREFTKIDAAVQ